MRKMLTCLDQIRCKHICTKDINIGQFWGVFLLNKLNATLYLRGSFDSAHCLHGNSHKKVRFSSIPSPLPSPPSRPFLPTFSCGYHIPDSHSHDKHRFMHSALISQQVILRSYAPFGANFLQETNGGFARRNQCHLAGYLKHMLNISSKLIAM